MEGIFTREGKVGVKNNGKRVEDWEVIWKGQFEE